MPEQEQNLQQGQEQNQPKQENKITLTWILLGMLAIAVMWALSSLLFK